mgnify:CR=1 FL=1
MGIYGRGAGRGKGEQGERVPFVTFFLILVFHRVFHRFSASIFGQIGICFRNLK